VLTRQGQEMILFKTPIPALWPIQPAIRWVPGVQRLGFEVDYLHLVSRSRVSGIVRLLSPYAFMACIRTALFYLTY
jgi:hypothetical protein